MKTILSRGNSTLALATVLVTLWCGGPGAWAQSTAFTYQGRLNDGIGLASGIYDLKFTVFDAASAGGAVSGALTNTATSVSNGVFSATLDFGAGVFSGAERWLEIAVRTNGGGAFVTLNPRQRMTSAPYAITAGHVGGGGLAGTYGNAVTFNNSGNSFSGGFNGNGGGLTNVNAATVNGLRASNFWQLNGNNVAPGQFLGSTNNQPLELRVNNTRALRLEPAGQSSTLVGGFFANTANGHASAVVAGGGTSGSINEAWGNYAFVGAGHGSKAAAYSAVVAGAYNAAHGEFSFIGSGLQNTNRADYSMIGGGTFNLIEAAAMAATIAGGDVNRIGLGSTQSAIGGGHLNAIGSNAPRATIAGGFGNNIEFNSENATISGGSGNQVRAGSHSAVIGGGGNNLIGTTANWATIAGGTLNTIHAGNRSATISGGGHNTIETNSPMSSISGGQENRIRAYSPASVVGGGNLNVIGTNAGGATIAGGRQNGIADAAFNATIGGGFMNSIQGDAFSSVLAGGVQNQIQPGARLSVISGGGQNSVGADALVSTIGGGNLNIIQSGAVNSTIGGGVFNVVLPNADSATIPGGAGNSATSYAFAAGNSAQANHRGSFVWADSSGGSFSSTSNNQFNVRAHGGVRMETAGAGILLDGQPLLAYRAGNGLQLDSGSFSLKPGSTLTNDDAVAYALKVVAPPGAWSGPIGLWGRGGGEIGLVPILPAGVLGESADGVGIWGVSAGTDPSSAGVYGLGLFNNTPGVRGSSGGGNGVQGTSSSAVASGVYGENLGDGYGIAGRSSEFGIAVLGDNPAGLAGRFNGRVELNGNVGIGTAADMLLHAGSGSARFELGIGHKFSLGGNGSFEIDAPGFVGGRFIVTDAGRVGMGRIPASNRLEVEGNASKSTAGSWLANSDRRIKTEIETVTNALEKLSRVRLASFRYTEEYRQAHPGIEDRKYLNVIAQEFQEVFPEAVKGSGDKLADGEEILQVDTYPLTIYSAAAVQELNQKLTAELKRRDAENEELKARLAALEQVVSALAQTQR